MSAAGSSGHADSPDARGAAAASPDRPGFEREVRDALSRLHDPGRLQSHPLTRLLKAEGTSRPSSLGRSLRQALVDAVEALKPSADQPASRHASRAYQILRLRYVEALEVSQVLDRLSLSESLYYLELQRAIESVSAVLWEQWGLGERSESVGRQARRGKDGGAASAVGDGQMGRREATRETTKEVSEEPPTNLPVQLTSFVGREREMAEVMRLLGANRLLTLTGAGGCGKTRLALQVAAGLLAEQPDQYPDGVWLVELAPLADPLLVPQTVASALGLREEAGRPILDTLLDHLKPKRLLLILDNCEHLLDSAARLADSILRACPKITFLTTSREALGISGETSYRVPSLSLPDPQQRSSLEVLAQCESVRLFVERARAVQPTFSVTNQNAPSLARICWRLDGIPLALELAAARVRGLSIEGIASRLDDRFRLLTGGSRTALRRQQTLRATIDWSYDLLSEPERVLFRRVAVFAGGWTPQAAEEVCSGPGSTADVEQTDVLDLLLRLVDRSLVGAEVDAEEERYHLPETVRQYALEELLKSGEAAAVRDRHRDWCLRLLSTDWRGWTVEQGRHYSERLGLEFDNLRGALAWCLETDPALGLHLAASGHFTFGVFFLWMGRGYPSEGRQRLRQLLDRAPDHTKTRAQALGSCAWFASDLGDLLEAEALAEESLGIARELGDIEEAIGALILLGEVSRQQGDYARARATLEEARSLGRSSGDRAAVAQVTFWLALVLSSEGDYRGARAAWEEAISESRATGQEHLSRPASAVLGFLEAAEGNTRHGREMLEESVSATRESIDLSALGWSLSLLGYAYFLDGSRDRAVSLLRESLVVLQRMGHRLRLGRCLSFLAIVEGASGAHEKAARFIGAAMKLIGESKPEFFASERVDREACLAAARAVLDEETFARAWAEGQAMTLEQAVEYALQDEP